MRQCVRLLDEQVDRPVAANLRAAGGGVMIWDAVVQLLRETLIRTLEVDVVKANAWRRFLEQRSAHGKVLYTVTEPADIAGAGRP